MATGKHDILIIPSIYALSAENARYDCLLQLNVK